MYRLVTSDHRQLSRVDCLTKERGIFLVPFVSESDAPVDTLTMQPHDFPRVLRARHVGLHDSDVDCSCLQLTRSELWYTWVQHTDPGVIKTTTTQTIGSY
jgi:hypothetical protein